VGKVYKDKKSSGCALCKPYKHGWAPKKKERDRFMTKVAEKEIQEFYIDSNAIALVLFWQDYENSDIW